MKKLWLLLALGCLFSTSRGQVISGSTQVDIDASSGMVTAQCETDLDGETASYYSALVSCVLRDSNGNVVADQTASDDEDGYVSVVLEVQGTPGMTYTATGSHRAYVTYIEQDSPDCDPDDHGCRKGTFNTYIDIYNFESFSEGSSNVYPYSDWQGPGPEIDVRERTLTIGNTKDTGTAPQVPTTASTLSNILTKWNNQTAAECDGTPIGSNVYGYGRCIQYQVNDQASPASAIQKTFTIHEVVEDLVTNFGSNAHQGDSSSNANGIFLDFVALTGSKAFQSGMCAYAKQTFSVNSRTIRINCLHYTSTDATVTDITTSPSSCSITCP